MTISNLMSPGTRLYLLDPGTDPESYVMVCVGGGGEGKGGFKH